MVERGGENTFGDQTHDIFNDLPKAIRVIQDHLQDPCLFNIKLTMVIY